MSEILELEVSADVLAALTGMSRRWVFDRATDGTITRIGRGKFQLAESLPALIAFMTRGELGEEIDKARLRKLNADAARAEHALDVERRKYVLVDDVERAWGHLTMGLQRNLMNVPGRAVLQLLRETDEATWKQKLKAEIVSALEQNKADIFNMTKEDFYDEQDDEISDD
ncbi:hypothetical protein KDW37_24075 [Burkholderia cenocepacia]|uniref:hypothetical protein n=1 Tax=Burkholderia cenocepacia TaxID=95486 RepID=UPI001B990C83|nr:hypothetical protein [Burkholderia cenocepacia]MBR8433837.1 hypothetical protein [Burkholderia cenocepacia]